jgi:NADH-ubiquinone oxidoreductase MWFE subunit
MGWNAIPSLAIITGIWAVGLFALDKVQLAREDNKPAWAINKDLFQKALYRRDWYLRREEETLSK